MNILLSTIGTRGEVQPLVALALELQMLGHTPHFCIPPNFTAWVESLGFECAPIGPDIERFMSMPRPAAPLMPSAARRRELAAQTIHEQFRILPDAARGCEVIVAAGALQLAAPSVAQVLGIHLVHVTYCPVTLPSAYHPPPRVDIAHPLSLPSDDNRRLWQRERRSWNTRFQSSLNAERARFGLKRITNVRRYVFTDRPWIAADPALAPTVATRGVHSVQTGTWLMPAMAALPPELERFLASGGAPVYLGFGSMRASDDTGQMLVEAVRALGCRAILSRGWGNLTPPDSSNDILSIGDVDHARLFPHVAAVVHHGGAGTTATAARAGVPQLIVPHNYDQFYWANRVSQLQIGVAGPARDELTLDTLLPALRDTLQPEIAIRARELSADIVSDGAARAARLLTDLVDVVSAPRQRRIPHSR